MHKTTKWLLAGALGVIGMTFSATPSWAAFTSKAIVTSTATVQFVGAGQTAVSIQALRLVSDNNTTDQVRWTGVNLPISWVRSAAYAVVASTITDLTGGIRLYTDNRNSSVAYTGASTSTVSGLVNNSSPSKPSLDLAWHLEDSVPATPPNAGDPSVIFAWLYTKDTFSADLAGNPILDYSVVKDTRGGHYGPAATEFGPMASPDYLYFQANFTNAVTPNTYSTTKLLLEAFTN